MKKFTVIFFLISFVAFSSEDMTISFINYKFDPLENSPKMRNELQMTETDGENYYILQFTGPIYTEWKDKIAGAGGVFHSYIPHFAYVVQMTQEEKNEIEKFSFVRWIGLFHPAYKIHPDVYEKTDNNRAENRLTMAVGKIENNELKILEERECPCGKDALWVENDPLLHLSVRFFPDASLENIAGELENWGSHIQQIQENCNRIIVRIPPDSLDALANIKEIESIEPYSKVVLSSSTWRYSVQEPRDSFTITSDTDLGQSMDTVTNGFTLADKGITGEGEIVTIFDTGLDYWSGFFQDPQNDPPGNNHIAVQAYTDEGGDDREVSSSTVPYGCSHGSNVSSMVAGNPSIADNHPNGGNLMHFYDWGGQTRGNTVDHFPVRLYIQDFGYTENDTCKLGAFNLTTAMNKAYTTYGSRIHQNSWNYTGNYGAYLLEAIDVDNMVWNNKDFVVVFSAGNFGPGATTVAPPATAKNCICVGASWNPSFDVSPDSTANFSSRGWTTDNRIKPEVVAPGGSDHLLSTIYRRYLWGAGPNTTWAGDSAHTNIRGMVGTSQAAPQVSAASAMIREYFKDGFYPTGDTLTGTPFGPSAALVKAVFIASTVDMGTGGGQGNPVPNQAEGWGRVVLDNALFFSGESRVLFVSDDEEVSTDDSVVTTVTVINSSEPLKFVLAWSDVAASVLANPTLVNDLDLIVTAPNSDRYRGNVFSGGYSQTGGSFDRRNNVEVVWLPTSVQTGTYSIIVKGYNCPNGSIPFAVAAVGGLQGGSGIDDPDINETREYKYLNIRTPFVEKIDIRLNIVKESNVILSIYDIAGREIAKLIDEKLASGDYSVKWGEKQITGVYFAVLKIDGKKVEERKIVRIGK